MSRDGGEHRQDQATKHQNEPIEQRERINLTLEKPINTIKQNEGQQDEIGGLPY